MTAPSGTQGRNPGGHRLGERRERGAPAGGERMERPHAVARGEIVRIPMPRVAGGDGRGRPAAGVAAAARCCAQTAATPPATPPRRLAAELPPDSAAASAPERRKGRRAARPASRCRARQTESAALLPAESADGRHGCDRLRGGTGRHGRGAGRGDARPFLGLDHIDSRTLRRLNRLHKNAQVTLGRKIKLDLSKVTAAQFMAVRRDYHRHLQEAFFAAHRIAGTENYTVKRGESLWTVALQHGDLPIWLVAQYNPDVDFRDIRPGTAITLPQVADINRQ